MSRIKIHYCLKCGRKFYTRDPSMLYCNEGCKWDSTHKDAKLLKERSPKMVMNKFGELEAIENIEGENKMAKKIINTVRTKTDMGKTIETIEKEAFDNESSSKADKVVRKLEKKKDFLLEQIKAAVSELRDNNNKIMRLEEENASLNESIEKLNNMLDLIEDFLKDEEDEAA